MAQKPSERELELAARVNELADDEVAPKVASIAMLSLAVAFLRTHVGKGVITFIVAMFVIYQGWAAFNDARQGMADLQAKRAEAGQLEAEATAVNASINGGSVQLETLLAQIAKTQAEADQAKAEANAQTQLFNGMSVAVAQKKADVAALEAQFRNEATGLRFLMNVNR